LSSGSSEGDHEARGLIVAGFFGDLSYADLYADSDKGSAEVVAWLGPQAYSLASAKRLLSEGQAAALDPGPAAARVRPIAEVRRGGGRADRLVVAQSPGEICWLYARTLRRGPADRLAGRARSLRWSTRS
jgi:hypothetical protein